MNNTDKTIYLVILNITSWEGSHDAEHVYGNLILSEKLEVNINNVEGWNVKYLGENIELKRPLTLELAKQLDRKDGSNSYQRAFRWVQEGSEFIKENPDYALTERFDNIEQIVNFGIEKYKELNINASFISLYEGTKYKANKYNNSSSVIIEYKS